MVAGWGGAEREAARLNQSAMEALHEVAVAAGRPHDGAALAQLVVDRARVIARGDAAVLRWFDPGSESFRLLATSGTPADPALEIGAQTPTAISNAFQTGQPVIVNDYRASGQTTSWGRTHRIRAQVAVPLMVEGRAEGTLAVLSLGRRRFTRSDALFLSLMAAIVGPALEAARLTDEVTRQKAIAERVYDALGVFVVVYDRHGRPIHYNSAAQGAWPDTARDPSGVRDHTYPMHRPDGTSLTGAERPFARALAEKAPVRGVVAGYEVDGQLRWALVDAVPILDQAGQVDCVITSSVDITDLKAAEERQQRDAALLRKLIAVQTELGNPELQPDQIMALVTRSSVAMTGAPGAAVQMLDGDEVIVSASEGFGAELIGRRFPTRGNPIRGCVAEGGAESTGDALFDARCNQEVARTTGIRSLVMAPIRDHGSVIGGLQAQSPKPNAFEGTVHTTVELLAGFAGAAISRARTAEALRASEELLSGAFQASGVGMALTSLDGSVTRANPALCAMLGYSECELAGMSTRQLVVPEDLKNAYDALAGLYRAASNVVTDDVRILRKDGQVLWTRLTASLVKVGDEPRHVLLHLIDVTEERRAKAILEGEQQRLAVIIEAQREIANSELDFERLLKVLAERTAGLIGGGSVAVLLPDGANLVVHAAAGEPEIPVGFQLPISDSLAGAAFRTGLLQRVDDAKNDDRVHVPTARIKRLGAMVSAPLVTDDGVIGVLQLISEQAAVLDEIDSGTLEMIAGFAAAASQRATTTRRLVASEHRVRAVMDSAPDPIVVFNADGEVVDFNPAAEAAFLRPRNEVIGRSAMILLSPKHIEAFERWNRAGREADSHEYAGRAFEATGRRSDGTEFPMEIVVTDLPEASRLVAVFVRDLTLRDRLKESSERLASVVASAPVIFLALDRNGVVALAEGSGLSVLNLTSGLAVGRDIRELAAWGSNGAALMERVAGGEPVDGRLHLTQPDVYLNLASRALKDGDGTFTGMSVVLTDVTARVRAWEAQRESEAKSRLMAMMNHEVRTPLNSILGFAHLLKDPQYGALNEKQLRYVANIESSGDHLLELVNESLDLARVDLGRVQINLADVPVTEVMEQAADQIRPLADVNGLSLVVVPAPELRAHADRRQVVRVVLNLLSNAVRHTHAGGSVTLAARRDGPEILLSVTDTGDGISSSDQARLFEEFFQAGNHAPGGTGLGLAISRRLLQLMGGAIEVESELGRGSTFTIRLRSA